MEDGVKVTSFDSGSGNIRLFEVSVQPGEAQRSAPTAAGRGLNSCTRIWRAEDSTQIGAVFTRQPDSQGWQVARSFPMVTEDMSWECVWLLHVGTWMVERGFRSKVNRTSRRDRSYVKLDQCWLKCCLINRITLRTGIRAYF